MRKLSSFLQVSLDGYFAYADGGLGWAKANQDAEFQEFVEGNAQGGGQLVFGRVTYEMMASYWPTPLAAQQNPVVAERMNSLPKIVFTRTLDKTSWSNTQRIRDDLATAVRALKQQAGPNLAILGSGSLVAQLAEQRLIDELQFVVNPVVLGRGRRVFDGLGDHLPFKLARSRTFGNGSVFLCYQPVV
jgi:dihydrofolate reductase